MKGVKSEFSEIGFTTYEIRIIRALNQENDLRVCKLAQSSGVPQSKIYETLNTLIRKKIVEKSVWHINRKITKKEKEKIVKALETSLNMGIHIRLVGLRKLKTIFHLNGNLENHIDGFIENKVRRMNELKKQITPLVRHG